MPKNLIGTSLDQVPVNGMLGELAFQNKESINFTGGSGALSKLDLNPIYKEISVSAIDVFVYDTRKDSDGGAWRKRIQHTSWYNEELNTATRGSRREFPAVAVIVVQTGYVTIHDGDDPTLPMWMGFKDASFASHLWENIAFCTTALNGKIAVGSSPYDLNVVDFIADKAVSYSTDSLISGTHKFPISGRAPITGSYSAPADVWTFGTVGNIIGLYINDVTMVVLPGAPIDPVTGLPIPTIAVATGNGVSVIQNNGTIVNKSGGVYLRVESFDDYYIAKSSGDDFSVIKWNDTGTTISFATGDYRYNGKPATGMFPYLYGNGGKVNAVGTRTFAYAASISGVQLYYNESGTTDRQTMCASVNTNHNKGWMSGDIKGAWISDTTQETVVSSELVTNRTFDSNTTTGWVAYFSTLSASSNQMTITRSGGTGLTAYQTINKQIEKTYVFSAKVNSSGSRGDIIIKNGDDGGGTTISNLVGTSGQTVIQQTQLVATTTQHTIMFAVDAGGTSIIVDDITCRVGEADRSINAKGVQAFGNIIKTPVATGAELVAYSGWGNNTDH
jgi:hypothetical protein